MVRAMKPSHEAAIMKNGLPEGLADFCPKIQTSFWSTFFATKTDEDDIDQGVIKSQTIFGGITLKLQIVQLLN